MNVVVNDGGTLTGYNTDVVGIGKALEVAGIDPRGGRVLVMGSGGAARACLHFMDGAGCDVTVAARNKVTGNELARDFGQQYRAPENVSIKMYDLVVNCTPVGMYSDGPYPVNISGLDHEQAVFDMVYGTETPLVRQGLDRGCRVAYGADMLAGQGAEAFRLWTGIDGSFDVMRGELD